MEVSAKEERNLKIRKCRQDVPGTSSQKGAGNRRGTAEVDEMTILARDPAGDSVAEEMKKMGLAE